MLNAKKIVGLSLFLCLSGIMGCSNANKQNMKLQPAIIKDDSEKINVTLDPNAHIDHIDPCHTKEKNICSMNDTVSKDGISYKIKKVEITKSFGTRNEETLQKDLLENVDKNNNLVGDETYVFITMTITNNNKEKKQISRTPGIIVTIDDDMEICEVAGGDDVYIDEYWNGGDPDNVYAYELEAGESVTSEFAGVVHDKDIQMKGRKLYYGIKHSDSLDDPKNKYIKLEE